MKQYSFLITIAIALDLHIRSIRICRFIWGRAALKPDKYKGTETFRVEGFMSHKQTIQIGDMLVTPFLCDHSAFDSYMIFVEYGNEKTIYDGDFRAKGRKPFH